MSNESNELRANRRPLGRAGLVGLTLVAAALTAGVAATAPPLAALAQSEASPSPEATAAPDSGSDDQGAWWPGRRMLGRFGDDRGRGPFAERGLRGLRDEIAGFLGGRLGRGAVTVDANDGTSLTLSTDNGWTRTIDTTGIALTRDGETITIADIAVDDQVVVHETRNSDGSYTVTEIEVIVPRVAGTVAEVGADGFTITTLDGGTQSVHVSDATTFVVPGATESGLAALTVGYPVMAQGTLREDGSMDATDVWSAGRGLRWMQVPSTPDSTE
jgi:hypothetical protein